MFPWTPHGLHKSSWTLHNLLKSHDNPFKVLWSPHGVPVESSWSPHGVHGVLMESMESSWSPCGVPVESSWSPWSPHGVPVESPWSPRGVPVESSWSPWSPLGVPVKSGFNTGIPRVGFSHTVPEPAYTVTHHGYTCTRTVNHAVSNGIIRTLSFYSWKSLK